MWHATLITTPEGSFTKKRRMPQGSSVSGYTISRFRLTASACAASTSPTSIDTRASATPRSRPPSGEATVSCTAEFSREANIMKPSSSMATRKPRNPS